VLGDPVNGIDSEGLFVWSAAAAVIGGAWGGGVSFYSTVSSYTESGRSINWGNVVAQTAIGAVGGAVSGATLGRASTISDVATAAASAATNIYFNGGSALDVAAAGMGILANLAGSKMGTDTQMAIFSQMMGRKTSAQMLHDIAASLTAAQKVILANVLSFTLGISYAEAMSYIEGGEC